ncbi:MAG TPA: aromatic amino acid ammonia-lyase [Glaciibacter sp.]|nr:aromatic amino acid ammonia-lyase [Glaciibacter sp.]
MVEISGNSTISDIVAIASGEAVEISDAVVSSIAKANDDADALSRRVPTYGRTTGVGANRLTGVDSDDDAHALRLLRSHAVDAGTPLPAPLVRAMLAVRLSQLSVPGSGVNPEILPGLVAMLNRKALPEIREFGSIGTADLSALAGTALALMGERPTSAPLEPMPTWGVDSALAFMSSSALTIGRGCLAVAELDGLERASSVVYALSFRALDGNDSALSAAAAAASGAPGVDDLAARVRSVLESSGSGRDAARIQDPYGLRVYAIAQGALRHAVDFLGSQLTRLADTAQENPLFDFAGDTVVHHGAFFQGALALALDGATLALAQSAPITLSRIRMLNEPEFNGGLPFLASGPAGSSGLMMVEYVAASAIAEMRASAQPASLGTVVLSRGAEDDASFASQGAVQLERAVAAYRVLLASELVGAVRLLRQRGITESAPGIIRDALTVTAALPTDDADRDLRGDIETAGRLLGDLAALVPGGLS